MAGVADPRRPGRLRASARFVAKLAEGIARQRRLGFFPTGFSVRNGLSLPHTLIARRVKSGRAVWRFRGYGYLDGTPLAVNDTVYVGSGSGVLYGVAARTGRVRWRDRLGLPIPTSPAPWDLQTGMAAAEGTLVVPALRRVVAYR